MSRYEKKLKEIEIWEGTSGNMLPRFTVPFRMNAYLQVDDEHDVESDDGAKRPDVVAELSEGAPDEVSAVEADERMPQSESDPLAELAEAHRLVVAIAAIEVGIP